MFVQLRDYRDILKMQKFATDFTDSNDIGTKISKMLFAVVYRVRAKMTGSIGATAYACHVPGPL
jgi:hypothetical protein